MAETNPRKIYVGNLPRDYTDVALSEDFSKFGRIRRIEFKGRSDNYAKFGFIEYDSPTSASDAVSQMNGLVIGGDKIQVKSYYYVAQRGRNHAYFNMGGHRINTVRGDAPRSLYRVAVHGLNELTNWQDLKDFGRKVGVVNFADVHRGTDGAFRGILEFQDAAAMNAAIERLSGTELLGSVVRLTRERSTSPTHRRSYSNDPAVARSTAENRHPPKIFTSNYKSSHDMMHHKPTVPSYGEFGCRGHHRSRSPPYYPHHYNSPGSYHHYHRHHPSPPIGSMRSSKLSVSPMRRPVMPYGSSSGHRDYSYMSRGPHYGSRERHRSHFYDKPIYMPEGSGKFSPGFDHHHHHHHHGHHHAYPGPYNSGSPAFDGHKSGRLMSNDEYSIERRSIKTSAAPPYLHRRY